VPEVRLADSLAAAIEAASGARIVLDPSSDGELAIGAAADVTVISGPEGGLAPGELDELARAGFTAVGLGPRILRAETAPVIAVALIRAQTRS
jgi:16S rRNA (uracil1498-N3)-methyltransferase